MAFGRRNKLSVDIWNYNLYLLGEEKVGKTTLIYELLKDTVGEDGYLFAEMGSEQGADAIEGINYVNVPVWNKDSVENEAELDTWDLQNKVDLDTLINDIVENKTTEYPNLKVLAVDTCDHLIRMAMEELLRRKNLQIKRKGKGDLKESFNELGYGKDEDLYRLLDEFRTKLSSVGIKFVWIGHTKTKNSIDETTGEKYRSITSNLDPRWHKYFANDAHVMGIAYKDRQIIKKGKTQLIKGENRKIKFRDEDDYVIESGSRFKYIVPEIDFDAKEFKKAIEDAIKKEIESNGKRKVEDAKKEDKKLAKETEKIVEEANKRKKEKDKLKKVLEEILEYIKEHKGEPELLKPIVTKLKELGYTDPRTIDKIDDALEVLELTK
jgi:hypothetical protein